MPDRGFSSTIDRRTPAPHPATGVSSARIAVLDVLRGLAICGTLGSNVWLFANPHGPASLFVGQDATDPAQHALVTLTNGKLLALLTLLFGIGLELQYRSAIRRGLRWPGRYLWRAALLFAEGLLHYVLVFEWDVLMPYAVTSILVAYLVGRSPRVQAAWMVLQGTILVLVVAGLTALLIATERQATGDDQPFTLYTHGSWLEQVRFRLDNIVLFRIEALFIVPLGTVLFLAGIRLFRAGVFARTRAGARLRRRLVAYGFGLGVPLNIATALAGPAWYLVDRYLGPPLIALGLLGAVTSVVYRLSEPPGWILRGLASVGRTAMSCYVFQNVAASVLCYGWGLGLAAHLTWGRPWSVVLLWAGIVSMFVVLASWWLRRFPRGPLELVWHWAYELPWRRAAAANPASPRA